MSLGKNLLKARELKGLTQGALAKLTGWSEDQPENGVSQGAISAIEKRNSQSSRHAPSLAKALGLSLNELLGTQPSLFQTNEPKLEYRDPKLIAKKSFSRHQRARLNKYIILFKK